MIITARGELKEQVRGVLIKRNVADFIADQNAVATQPCQLGSKLATGVGFCSRATEPVAVSKRTRWPCLAA